jgi:hypothetical protein
MPAGYFWIGEDREFTGLMPSPAPVRWLRARPSVFWDYFPSVNLPPRLPSASGGSRECEALTPQPAPKARADGGASCGRYRVRPIATLLPQLDQQLKRLDQRAATAASRPARRLWICPELYLSGLFYSP